MCCRKSIAVTLLLVALVLGAKKPSKKSDAPEPSQSADSAVPPRDAQWTIYCQAVSGPDHVAQANSFKKQLVAVTSMKDFYVLHQDDQSVIYYGWYRVINDSKDKKETDRAQKDRKALTEVKDVHGVKVLTACMFVEVTAPDPAAPPQWNVQNALGYWTIEIGMYKEHPQRKQAAVDAVRAAREQGVEAYYYHGPTASSILVGAWPRDAVREQEKEAGGARDPNQDVLILPAPINVPGEFRNQQGERVQALAPRIEPLDPSLVATMAKYPHRAVNGEVFSVTVKDPANGQEKQMPDPSVLVRIPASAGPSLLRQHEPPPSLVTPINPSQTPGAGKLKSIGQ